MAELGDGESPRSDYPGTLDTDATLETTSTAIRPDVPNDCAAAIINIQTELGTDPAGTLSNVVTYLQTDHNADGTHKTALTLTTPLISGAAPSPPIANRIYTDSLVKGWINFTGTSTITTNDSYNVSGIVDNATGDYTITWDKDFANANYSVVASATETGGADILATINTIAAGSVQVETYDSGTQEDASKVFAIAIGDQS